MGFVYKFLDYDNEIIYIGKTKNLKVRMKQHFLRGHLPQECYQNVSRIFFCEINGQTNTEMMETYLINKYHPFYNEDKNYAENIDTHKDKHLEQSEPNWSELYFDFYENDIILSNTPIPPVYCDRNLSDREKCIAILKQNLGRMKFEKGLYARYINYDELDDLLEYFSIVHKEVLRNIDYENSNVDEPITYEDSFEYVAFNIHSIHTINVQYLMLLSQLHLIIHLYDDIYGIVIHNMGIMKQMPIIF